MDRIDLNKYEEDQIKIIKEYPNYSCTIDGIIFNNKTNIILHPFIDNVGYLQLILRDENGNKKHIRVHRIIAKYFVSNPNNLDFINHIDGNKINSRANNLEWVTNSENTKHGYDNNLYHSKHRNIKIEVYDLDNNYLNTFKSIRSASESLGINRKTLSRILFDNKTNNYNYKFKIID